MLDTKNKLDRYACATPEDRCAPRHSVNIPGQLRPSCGKAQPITIKDISLAGFAGEAVTGMPVGALCWISLPGLGSQQAEVIWNTGFMVGCAFSTLLSQVVVDNILARNHQLIFA
jgi:hypothetical protein